MFLAARYSLFEKRLDGFHGIGAVLPLVVFVKRFDEVFLEEAKDQVVGGIDGVTALRKVALLGEATGGALRRFCSVI